MGLSRSFLQRDTESNAGCLNLSVVLEKGVVEVQGRGYVWLSGGRAMAAKD